ncbi:MAG: hypothetical protein U0694_20885 [Anaerolineae bacterium]
MSNEKPKSISEIFQYIINITKLTNLDFQTPDDGLRDILEELEELKRAENPQRRFEEAGDVLFAVLNWMRWLGIEDPEAALSASTDRFQQRLQHLRKMIAAEGKTLSDYSTDQLRNMWEDAKKQSY